MPGCNTDVKQAAKLLKKGGVGAFPTETVYGLGADAFNADAVARLFEIKERPFFDPLIVHVATMGELATLVAHLPECIREIEEHFWPGPLTLVLPKRDLVPDIVTSGLDSVAVRWPAHPMALELIGQAETPVAAPSANLFGKVSPTTAQHVKEQLGERIDFVLDGGPCVVGVESTILSFMGGKPTILRYGGLPREELEEVLGPVEIAVSNRESPQAPGMLKRHYAPRTPVAFKGDVEKAADGVGLLTLKGTPDMARYEHVEVLSVDGDLREAAANLFSALRRLDGAGLRRIDVERVPEWGLGRAINDRLEKACATHG